MLKKDLIELCLLHLLDVEDLYGYEILHRIHRRAQFTPCSVACVKMVAPNNMKEKFRKALQENTIILPRLDNQSERNYSMNGVDSVILS